MNRYHSHSALSFGFYEFVEKDGDILINIKYYTAQKSLSMKEGQEHITIPCDKIEDVELLTNHEDNHFKAAIKMKNKIIWTYWTLKETKEITEFLYDLGDFIFEGVNLPPDKKIKEK